MTKEQERTIERIRRYMLERYGKREDNLRYEIKEEHIEELEGTNLVSYWVQNGMVNDEGTYASIICRDTVHVFIGKKGGCSTFVKARSGKNKGKMVEYTDNWLGCCHRSMEENM